MLRVFESRVLRRMFGPKRDEVTGEWKKIHSEELNDLFCSHNIVRVTKSRRMRWAGHVARMGEGKGLYMGDSGVVERIILKRILRKWGWGFGLDRAGSG